MIRTQPAGAGEMALVLESADGGDDENCAAARGDVGLNDTAVLFVSFGDTHEEQLDFWRENPESAPDAVAVVRAGRGVESDESAAPTDVFVTAVPHPSNLTRLGVEINRALEHLESESEDSQIIVCFHSISALLQYAERDQVLQFLQVLRDRMAAADAAVHAHLDDAAHDEQTIATLSWMFDVVGE